MTMTRLACAGVALVAVAGCSGHVDSPTDTGGIPPVVFHLGGVVEPFANGANGVTIVLKGNRNADHTVEGFVCKPDDDWTFYWSGGKNPYNEDPMNYHMDHGNVFARAPSGQECWLNIGDGRWRFDNAHVVGSEIQFDINLTGISQYRVVLEDASAE